MPRGVSNQNLADKIAKKAEPVHMKHYGSEQASIIRQSSLKSAVELTSQWYSTQEDKLELKQVTELTLLVAEKFEEWVNR
jgi:hypothetical protein